LKYVLQKKGPFTTNALECCAFVQSGLRPDLGTAPDLQLHVVASLGEPKDTANFGMKKHLRPSGAQQSKNGYSILPTLLHPKSIGFIELRSADPLAAPVIQPNYLAHPDDVKVLIAGLRLTMKIVEAKALAEITTRPNGVGEGVDALCPHKRYSDEYFEYMIRQSAATVYHPVGTCKMGPADAKDSVCNPQLEVLGGITGLRVADCAIMPTLVSGNTNAAAIMVGEKAADIIRAHWARKQGGVEQ